MEALVAVALLAAILWPFYALVENLHRSAILLEISAEYPRIERTALRVIETHSGAASGSLEIEGWTIDWTSETDGEPRLAGGRYQMDMHLVRIDIVTLRARKNEYSRQSAHRILVFERQYVAPDDVMDN